MNKKSWFKKIILAVAGIAALGAGIYYVYTPRGPIYEYNEARDTQSILDLFRKNWYWLTASEDYSPEFMLKYRTPTRSFSDFGKMHIKVLRVNGKFAGFVAYFMETDTLGDLRFIVLKEGMRGKGYAQKLMRYAINDMIKMGAKHIKLVTRTDNLSGQKLYERTGYKEMSRVDGFVNYMYYVK